MLARSLTSRDAALPAESLKALDWLNFFLAAFLMGFGPFVAVHLTENGWAPASIGAVLTISGLAGLTTQVPAGELIDMIAPKRALVGVAVTAAALALTIFGLRSDFPSVAGAAIKGAAGSVFGPSIAAISLGLVGHDALAERLGRNQRFASIGGCQRLRSWVPLVSAIHARHISGRRRVGDPVTMGTSPDTRRRYSLRPVLWRSRSS